MDEEEISARIDARGRAAGAGTRRALAAEPVPLFDPDAVVVPLAGGSSRARRWLARGAVAAAVVVLAGVAGLVALGDQDDDPVVDTGPVRRFVADQIPEGLAPSFLASETSSSDGIGAELYGPAPLEVRAVVSIPPDEVAPGIGFEAEGRPDWDEATFGGRDGYVMTDVDLGWYGLAVVVDGVEVSILGVEEDRAALEQMAATVELADGEVVADSPDLPDGWSGQGRVADMYGALPAAFYGSGVGHSVAYFGSDDAGVSGITRSLTVSTGPGGVPEVAVVGALPLPGRERFDITVRDRPGLLVHAAGWPEVAGAGESWIVAWEERPGEVIRVAGYGLGRDEILAVAEGVRPAQPGEWERMEREGLRNFPQALPDEVILGEGTFSTGHPWVLAVQAGESAGTTMLPPALDEPTQESVGAPIPSGASRQHWIRVRTTATAGNGVSGSHTAMGSGDEADEAPFPEGISVETGDVLGWTFGLVGSAVATVELVGPDGAVLATTEVLAAGDFRGFLIELPSDVLDRVRGDFGMTLPPGPTTHPDPTTSVPSADGEGPATATTGVEVRPRHGGGDPSFQLVARAADGSELERRPLP